MESSIGTDHAVDFRYVPRSYLPDELCPSSRGHHGQFSARTINRRTAICTVETPLELQTALYPFVSYSLYVVRIRYRDMHSL
jgi:hypothetical protein